MVKNVFQPFRDWLPYYPGCIRTLVILMLSIGLFMGGIALIVDGRASSYIGYTADYINGEWVYKRQNRGQEADVGKLVAGSILIVLSVPLILSGIYYYFKLGCGNNRFYTNNLVKFEGRKAVRKARKARK